MGIVLLGDDHGREGVARNWDAIAQRTPISVSMDTMNERLFGHNLVYAFERLHEEGMGRKIWHRFA